MVNDPAGVSIFHLQGSTGANTSLENMNYLEELNAGHGVSFQHGLVPALSEVLSCIPI